MSETRRWTEYSAAQELEDRYNWLLDTLLIDTLNYPYDMHAAIPHPRWLIWELARRWWEKEQPHDQTLIDYLGTIELELGHESIREGEADNIPG